MGHWREAVGLAALIVSAGCSEMPTERQMEALNACTARWHTEYPQLYAGDDEKAGRRRLAVMEPELIEFDAQGIFLFEQPPSQWRDQYADQFVCRGNIDRRVIEYVGHNSEIRRPQPGIVWSF